MQFQIISNYSLHRKLFHKSTHKWQHHSSATHFEGFRPEWCISTIYHCRDIPFWLETLDLYHMEWKNSSPTDFDRVEITFIFNLFTAWRYFQMMSKTQFLLPLPKTKRKIWQYQDMLTSISTTLSRHNAYMPQFVTIIKSKQTHKQTRTTNDNLQHPPSLLPPSPPPPVLFSTTSISCMWTAIPKHYFFASTDSTPSPLCSFLQPPHPQCHICTHTHPNTPANTLNSVGVTVLKYLLWKQIKKKTKKKTKNTATAKKPQPSPPSPRKQPLPSPFFPKPAEGNNWNQTFPHSKHKCMYSLDVRMFAEMENGLKP